MSTWLGDGTAAYFEYDVERGTDFTFVVPIDFAGASVNLVSGRIELPDDPEQPVTDVVGDTVRAAFDAAQTLTYNGNRLVKVFVVLDDSTDERLLARGYLNFTDKVKHPAVGLDPVPVQFGDIVLNVRAALGGPRGFPGEGGEGLEEHILDPTPHPAYDDSMMDLSLWAQNQLI